MIFAAWAARWGIPPGAIAELQTCVFQLEGTPTAQEGASEAAVQSQVRLEASRKGGRLWRNNVGSFQDPRSGAWVRFGLCNDSAAVNAKVKSADLIGIRPVLITPAHVGQVLGRFWSVEVKAAGWQYRGDEHEQAQLAWINLVNALGGEALFASGEGAL